MVADKDNPCRELEEFDWFTYERPPGPLLVPKRPYLMFQAPIGETPYGRKLRMLEQIQHACMACSMCELGRKGVARDERVYRDPHVFSSMTPTRFMVVGQNPGWTEVCQCQPFVGDAGANFNREVEINGLKRTDFYICNTVRCFIESNTRPTEKHVQRCRPFLDIEVNLIQPLLIAALGGVAFERLCPGVKFGDALGTITESSVYEVPVFALYHPSPLNLQDEQRARAFAEQMRLFCGVVTHLMKREQKRIPKS